MAIETEVYMSRHIGLFKATGLVVGNIIGTGIFLTPQGITRNMGSTGASLAVWAFAGIVNTMAAVSLTELGALFPKAGGPYAFIREAFGPMIGFIVIWSDAVFGTPSSLVLMARSAGGYVLQLAFPDCVIPSIIPVLAGICLIWVMAFCNSLSIELAVKAHTLFFISKVTALVVIIISGIIHLAKGNVQSFTGDNFFKGSNWDAGAISLAVYGGYFTYQGWDRLYVLQEEVINPEKNLPRAIWLGMSMVMLVYMLTNVAYFSAMSPQQLVKSPAVALTYAETTLGTIAWIIPIFVGLSANGSVNGNLLGVSRNVFSGSRDGSFPSFLAMLHAKYSTPVPAILLTVSISMILMAVPDISTLISYSAVVNQFRASLSLFALLYLRIKKPHLHRPIKVFLVLPIFSLLVALVLTVLATITSPLRFGIGLAVGLSAIPVYLLNKKLLQRSNTVMDLTDKLTSKIQLFLGVVPESRGKNE